MIFIMQYRVEILNSADLPVFFNMLLRKAFSLQNQNVKVQYLRSAHQQDSHSCGMLTSLMQ